MTALPAKPQLLPATFAACNGSAAIGTPFPVQFNPESLEYTLTNEPDTQSASAGGRQIVKKSVAKLTLTLQFDTTLDGHDVRDHTAQISTLMRPTGRGQQRTPTLVIFGWGNFSFIGVIEQYKETLDFFSPDGVPLRAGINLTLSNQQATFESRTRPSSSADKKPAEEPVAASGSAKQAADALGDPRAARLIASLNGSASLRFSAGLGTPLEVGGQASLKGPVAPPPANRGAMSMQATAGASFTGLRQHAATAAAQAGARIDSPTARARLLPPAATRAGKQIGPGGQAAERRNHVADVQADAELPRIRFES